MSHQVEAMRALRDECDRLRDERDRLRALISDMRSAGDESAQVARLTRERNAVCNEVAGLTVQRDAAIRERNEARAERNALEGTARAAEYQLLFEAKREINAQLHDWRNWAKRYAMPDADSATLRLGIDQIIQQANDRVNKFALAANRAREELEQVKAELARVKYE